MDFKGHVGMNNGGRCHPLTILDDHSRYNILLLALANERGESVQAALVQAFTQYGLPERINIDNGAPWARRGGLTQLAVWLIRLGIRLSFSRPYHPQTNGKADRLCPTVTHVRAHVLPMSPHTCYPCVRSVQGSGVRVCIILYTHTVAPIAHQRSHHENPPHFRPCRRLRRPCLRANR